MKKKFISLFLAFMFLFACALPAFAGAGFDKSILLNDENVYYEEFANGGGGTYWPDATRVTYHDSQNDVGGVQTKIRFNPVIRINDKNDYENFRLFLWVYRKGDTPVNVDALCIRVSNSKEYTDHFFEAPKVNYSGKQRKVDDTQWLTDSCYVDLNKDSFALIDDIIANRDGTVEIWISLDTSDDWIYCAALSQDEIDSVIHLYNLYKQAGGLRKNNLDALESIGTQYHSNHKTKKK